MAKWPAAKHGLLERAVRIAGSLPGKSARDVALRLTWIAKGGAAGKRLKKGEPEKGVKGAQRPPRAGSIFAVQPGPVAGGAGGAAGGAEGAMDGGPGGTVAQLLQNNFDIITNIRNNMHQFKVNENTELLVRMRDNTLRILASMKQSEGVMSQMPELPVKMNLDLANSFLPKVMGQAPPMAPPPQPQQHMVMQMGPNGPIALGGMPQAICVSGMSGDMSMPMMQMAPGQLQMMQMAGPGGPHHMRFVHAPPPGQPQHSGPMLMAAAQHQQHQQQQQQQQQVGGGMH